MLTHLAKWITDRTISKAIGISIFSYGNDDLEVVVVAVSKSKQGELIIEDKMIFGDVEKGCDWIHENYPNFPALLIIDGKSVLTRLFNEEQIDSQVSKATILRQMIPGAKPDQFYVNSFLSELGYVTAVSRMDNINDFLPIIKQSGINLFEVFIGPCAYFNLFSHFKEKDNQLNQFGFYTIESHDSDFLIKRSVEQSHDLLKSEFDVEQRHVAAFGAAMAYFVLITENGYFDDIVSEQKRDFRSAQLYNVLIWLLPALLLALLTLNAVVFIYYSTELNKLKESSSDKLILMETYERLKREYSSKSIIFDNLSPKNSFYSYCSDQIGMLITDGVLLDQLNINPSLQQRQNQIFQSGFVTISGQSSRPDQFGSLIDNLEQLPFVARIESQSYQLDSKTNKGYFQIRLSLTDEVD